MLEIDWFPPPLKMRLWATTLACALAVMGSLFQFVDWGIFSGGQGFGRFLWGFGGFAFVTGITGTRLGLPAYWAWMGFSYVVSTVLTYATLSLVFFTVVTPLALACHLAGRDRLQIHAGGAATWWHDLDPSRRHNPERQF
jgi:hypothetical protein